MTRTIPRLRTTRPSFVLEQAPSAGVPAVPARSCVTAVSAIGLLAVAVVAGGVAVYGSRPVTTAKPTVAVTLTAVDEGLRGEGLCHSGYAADRPYAISDVDRFASPTA